MERTSVAVPGARLGVSDRGSGEPVVFIQTALTADELRPVATDPALDDYRRIVYHRRGYAGSSPVDGSGSVQRDAADCAALLTELDVERAHVVGLSYSGAIALQLAADVPERVHSLILIEPPPVHVPSADEFRAANDRLIASRQERGAEAALEEFLTNVIGPDWQQVAEGALPGSSAQMRRDAATFFDTDLPALLTWRFGPEDAAGIGCPVLYVGGSDSGPWFAQVHELIRRWIPHADDVTIDGADHSLALTHAPRIAGALSAFLAGHPMGRTDRAGIVISAPRERIYAALIDPSVLEMWLPPDNMRGRVLEFDPRPGGKFRMELTYLDGSRGKSSADSDVTEVTFVELRPNERVVQRVVFDSDDPSFAGAMTMTWSLVGTSDGTAVEIRADDVPPGISPDDHASGLNSSLNNLAEHLAAHAGPNESPA